ncbi:alginate O-acetyltransferase AlgX-related protein [Chitinasiproducens palmae]|uniref:Alginate O-acetyltransferase complex protein AlgJ n=1 Tax=Chitinasiproducens palmae TaxID=1770053 RepID=A0A1H2PVB1_9BURK|nr:hypothetical protein [Chitinasiproducens palmae]SDV51255.1 alginate O-acetyltransferase complex protein AlgJ [Chitinasiproducens palmae]
MDPLAPHKLRRRAWRALPAVVLGAMMAAGLLGAVGALPAAWRAHGRNLIDDAARAQFSAALVATPFAQRLSRYQREVSWLLLRDLGPAVARGDENWLFLREEWQLFPGRTEHARQRADAVLALDRTLRAAGIALIVAVVPDKSRSVAARLGGLRRPPEIATRVEDWTRHLHDGGVDVLDLTAVLQGEQRFLHTDTHWNEAGSRLAADTIAVRLRARQTLGGPSAATVASRQAAVSEWGDLVRLAGIERLPGWLKPRPDEAMRTTFETQAADDDLFGEAGTPTLVVVGTSFSHRSQFLPWLQHATGTPVADFAQDGGGFATAARAYFDSAAFAEHRPRAIVWEIPERALEAPLDSVEAAWLDIVSRRQRAATEASRAASAKP